MKAFDKVSHSSLHKSDGLGINHTVLNWLQEFIAMYMSLQAVAVTLIAAAAYGKAVAIIATVSVLGGIIACGVFLLLIAIVGLIGAIRHHQVILFFVSFMQHFVNCDTI